MQRLFILLLFTASFFGCNKQEIIPDFGFPFGAEGEMTFRGESYPLSTGLASVTPDGSAPDFMGITLTGLLTSNGIQLSVRQIDDGGVPTGTFDFCNECAEIGSLFDGGATITIDEDFIAGTLTGGSVTIESRGGNNYRITFDLTYRMSDATSDENIEGQFEGAVIVA